MFRWGRRTSDTEGATQSTISDDNLSSLPPVGDAEAAAVIDMSQREREPFLHQVGFVWPDRALFVGMGPDTPVHQHFMIEVVVAMDDQGIKVTARGEVGGSLAGSVVIGGNESHALSIPGSRVGMLYVDPICDLGRHSAQRVGQSGKAALPTPEPTEVLDGLHGLL